MSQVSKRNFLAALPLLGLSSLVTGCSTGEILNAVVPKDEGSHRVAKDIAYGANARQTYDLYAPKKPKGDLPLIVFYYGGGWYAGDKSLYSFVGRALAALGYLVAVPDYRLYPEVRYPDFLSDCALAFEYIRQNARAHGGNPNKIALMGHSAGAYNAVMLALDDHYLKLSDDANSPLRAVIGISGPYDFYPFDVKASQQAFGAWPRPEETQPISYARTLKTQFLLMQSRDDEVVGMRNLTSLEAKLKAVNTPVETRLYDKINHQDMIACLSKPLRHKASVLADVKAFLSTIMA